jgi:hypothetical protein
MSGKVEESHDRLEFHGINQELYVIIISVQKNVIVNPLKPKFILIIFKNTILKGNTVHLHYKISPCSYCIRK